MAAGESVVVVKVLGDAGNLTKTLDAVPGQVERAFVPLRVHAASAGKELERTHGIFGRFAGAVAPIAGLVTGLGLAFSGFDIAKHLVGTLNDDEKAVAALSNAMHDAGEKALPDFKSRLEDAQHAGEKLGFSAAETTNALAEMRRAGIDTTTGMKELPTLMDLAAAKGIPLSDATHAVILAIQGQARALKDLNVQMPAALPNAKALTSAQDAYNKAVAAHGPNSRQALDALKKLDQAQANATDRTKNLSAVTDILKEKLGGSAAAAAETTSGKLKALGTQASDFGAHLLADVLPAVNVVLGALVTGFDWLEVYVPKIITAVASSGAWNAFIGTINVIAHVVITAVQVIVTAIQGIVTVVKSGAFQGLLTVITAPFKIAATVIGTVIGGIVGVIKGIVSTIGGVFSVVANVVMAPFRAIAGFINFIIDAINTVIKGINFVITSPVPIIGGHQAIGMLPHLPNFHSGGLVPGRSGEEVLAILKAGERVLTPEQARKRNEPRTIVNNISLHSNASADSIAREIAWRLRTVPV